MKAEEISREVIQQIDIKSELVGFGVDFTQQDPGKDGWLACWAVDRPRGNAPSAAVNLNTGVYKDFGGHGATESFFDLVAMLSDEFSDWRAARQHFAAKLNLPVELKDYERRADEKFKVVPWNDMKVLRVQKKRCVAATPANLLQFGGRLGGYPSKAVEEHRQLICALPAYGPKLDADVPRSYALIAADGGMVNLYRGQDAPTEPKKAIVVGTGSGILNQHCVSHWKEWETLVRVEGITDAITLQDAFDREYGSKQRKFGVFSTCNGATESKFVSEMQPLVINRNLVVIGDGDTAGQVGAATWVDTMKRAAKSLKNVVLFEDVKENHGPDVRDWLAEPVNTLAQLVRLFGEAEEQVPEDREEMTDEEVKEAVELDALNAEVASALRTIGCIVQGHAKDTGQILCFSEGTKRSVRLSGVGRIQSEDLIQKFGEPAARAIVYKDPKEGQVTLADVKKALALASSRNAIDMNDAQGAGIWDMGNHLLIVNAEEFGVWDGEFRRTPVLEGQAKFFEMPDHPWVDFVELEDALQRMNDAAHRKNVFEELVNLFSCWENWRHSEAPIVMAGLTLCTFIETLLPWRPQVFITGPSSSGKSQLTEAGGILENLFGGLSVPIAKPTEASIRQTIRNDACALMVDELEGGRHRPGVMELLRCAGGKSAITRGGKDHRASKFTMRHLVWISAIETGLSEKADKNRFIVLELNHFDSDRQSGLSSLLPDPAQQRKLGKECLALAIWLGKAIADRALDISGLRVEGFETRLVQCFAPVAAAVSLAMDSQASQLDSEQLLAGLMEVQRERSGASREESDEQELLDCLLSFTVRIGSEEMSIAKLLTTKEIRIGRDNQSPDEILENYGFGNVRAYGDRDDSVFVQPKVASRRCLKGTSYEQHVISDILLRIDGAKKCQKRFSGRRVKGISIPREHVFTESDNGDNVTFSDDSGFDRSDL